MKRVSCAICVGRRFLRRYAIESALFSAVLFSGLMLFYSAPASALTTAPTTLNFQGRLLDSTGTPVANGLYNMQFRLFTVASGGSATWTETRENSGSDYRVQVTNGLFTTKLGERTALSASLFSGNSVYFEITQATPATANCSTAACATWESPMSPRHQLSTSAYAFNSETLDGLDSTAFAAASGSANYIQNGTSLQAATNFNIAGTGTAGTLQAATLDTAAAGILTIGGANASSITLADNVSLSAGLSLTLVGGATGTRPGGAACTTEGMLYYDTTTHQLLTCSATGGKWQADRSEAILVAASDSSGADKAAADYLADGNTGAALDGDQVQINQALAAGSGKKVVLLAGTYTIDASISIPNHTTLSGVGVGTTTGAGQGTIITIPNSLNANFSAIVNTDQSTGTNVTIRDFKLDGNKANQSGAVGMAGIDFNNMGGGTGAGARQGARITGVQSNNWYLSSGSNCQTGVGICLRNSNNNTLTGNTAQGNSYGIYLTSSSNNTLAGNTTQGNTYGIYLYSSSNNTLTGNTTQGNGNGIYIQSSSNNTLTGNTAQGNGTGISLYSSSNNTLTGNTAQGNSTDGIHLENSSNNNTVSSNKIHDNGGATNNNGITLAGADYNTITGNDITDTACTNTTTCYAINIIDSTSDKNYLEANRFSGSATIAASINDLGTGTIYAGQQTGSTTSANSDVSDFRFRGSANSVTAFQIQNTSSVSLFTADTSSLVITVAGTTSTFATLTINNAHFKSTQTNAPNIATPTSCGTTPTATMGTGSTDTAGSFRITSGTGSPGTCSAVITFDKAYGAAPKSIMISPQNKDGGTAGTAAAKQVYVSGSGTSTFTATFGIAPATSEANWFYYWVVE